MAIRRIKYENKTLSKINYVKIIHTMENKCTRNEY